jgi:hypothetical protein
MQHHHKQPSSCLAFHHLTIAQVAELAANPHVEVCWYFPSSREQYRLSGSMAIITQDDSNQQLLQARQEAWARMSDAGDTACSS